MPKKLVAVDLAEVSRLPTEHRVEAGAADVATEYGPDWLDQVDLMTLDLRRPDRCVLGQVSIANGEGDFENGVFRLYGAWEGLSLDAKLVRGGFLAPAEFTAVDDVADQLVEEYQALTSAWLRLIVARRQERAGHRRDGRAVVGGREPR
jgi:hypothetical protein